MTTFFSYSLNDFIPYTQEIYYSLLSTSFDSSFKVHLIVVLLNLVWVGAFAKRKAAIQLCCLSVLWFVCGFYFYHNLYAQINWVASNMAWVCYTQAAFLLGLVPSALKKVPSKGSVPVPLVLISVTALGFAPLWPVFQVMNWNALALPGLNSSSLWALSFCSVLTFSHAKLKALTLLPGLLLVIYSAVRFCAFHVT